MGSLMIFLPINCAHFLAIHCLDRAHAKTQRRKNPQRVTD